MLYGRSGNQERRKGGATASRLATLACCLLLAAHCQLALAAPVEYRWHAESERTVAPDIPVWQGETVRLVPTFRSRAAAIDLSGDTFAFYWQTNGMGTAWWSVPAAAGAETGTVVATWSPTNDVGARAYTFFIASTSASGTSYRAHGRLLMRPAPGATPCVLAAPTTLTDALQSWGDAHYDPAGAAQAASNALAAAVQAEALARAAGDTIGLTNWQAIVYSMTNGAALGATALQPSWAITGTVAHAGDATTAENAGAADRAAVADAADYAVEAGLADEAIELVDWGQDGQSLDALIVHTNSPAAHPDIRAAIDAIPLPPTNVVAGWLVWDTGSNCYWRVSATNLRFYVWGVDP